MKKLSFKVKFNITFVNHTQKVIIRFSVTLRYNWRTNKANENLILLRNYIYKTIKMHLNVFNILTTVSITIWVKRFHNGEFY